MIPASPSGKQIKLKPGPSWFPNLVFLALTVSLIRWTIFFSWPETKLRFDVTGSMFYVIDEMSWLLLLTGTMFIIVLWRRYYSKQRERPSDGLRYLEAELKHPNPLLALSPIPEDKKPFQKVVDAEWSEIANGRYARGHSLSEPIRGLCFSGGGIRAASYMAGVLESFESEKILPECDYLSTVSGGGYTGSAFMTRDKEACHTVHRLVRRMTVNSDYLGVSANEGNTVAVMDLVLSVTAAIANNGIGVFAYSVVMAEYVNFILLWTFGSDVKENVVNFLLSDDSIYSISGFEGAVVKWSTIGLLGFSMVWIIAFGLYSATSPSSGAVRKKLTTSGCNLKYHKRRMSRPFPLPDQRNIFSPNGSPDELSKSFPLSESFTGDDEDDTSDDDVKSVQQSEAIQKGKFVGSSLQVNQLLSYLLRCAIILSTAVFSFFSLLHVMKFFLSSWITEDDNKGTQLFISVEMAAAVTFGVVRGFAAEGQTKGNGLRIIGLMVVGLCGVIAVIFIIGRVLLWRILGCGFGGETGIGPSLEPTLLTKVGEQCYSPPTPHLLLGLLIYVLVVEVFIREPLGQALHDMYRRRLVGSFYKNGSDKLFTSIPRRPYFICNAALNGMQDPRIGTRTTHPFFLSKRYCGSPLTGYRTAEYLNVHLSKGMAISGAALSTQFDTLMTAPMKMAMMLMGIDLGEWFSFRRNSPIRHYLVQLFSSIPFILLIFASQVDSDSPELSHPQVWLFALSLFSFITPVILMVIWGLLLQVFKLDKSNIFLHLPMFRRAYQFFGFLSWKKDPYFYLADGGWFDFFGLYELLRRGVSEIFMFDADADHTNFSDLMASLTVAEKDLDIEVDLSPTDEALSRAIQRQKGEHRNHDLIERNVLHIRVKYPFQPGQTTAKTCDIWIGKLSLTGDEPPWLKMYSLADSSFPHHDIQQQGFDSNTFRAYQQLGKYVASKMIETRSAYRAEQMQKSGVRFGTQ